MDRPPGETRAPLFVTETASRANPININEYVDADVVSSTTTQSSAQYSDTQVIPTSASLEGVGDWKGDWGRIVKTGKDSSLSMFDFVMQVGKLSYKKPHRKEDLSLASELMERIVRSEVVNEYVFRTLIGNFGPRLEDICGNMLDLFSKSWFQPLMPMEDVERWLGEAKPGQFVVTFALGSIVTYVIKIRNEPGMDSPILLDIVVNANYPAHGVSVMGDLFRTPPSGAFSMAIMKAFQATTYDSIFQVVNILKDHRAVPFYHPAAELPYFHGHITSENCSNLLKSQKGSSFLLRFSSVPYTFTMSSLVQNSHGQLEVQHTRIFIDENGRILDRNQAPLANSIEELLERAQLRNMVPNVSYETRAMRSMWVMAEYGNWYR